MQTIKKQQGMSFWSLIMVAGIMIFFVLMFFKLLPPYIEHAKVKTALKNMSQQQNAFNMEKAEIKAAMQRRFDIDEVNDVDLSKSLFVEKTPGVTTIRITYEKRVPLAYNITALIDFSHSVQVSAR